MTERDAAPLHVVGAGGLIASYAEPLYQSWGSMKLAQLTRSHARVETLPLIP